MMPSVQCHRILPVGAARLPAFRRSSAGALWRQSPGARVLTSQCRSAEVAAAVDSHLRHILVSSAAPAPPGGADRLRHLEQQEQQREPLPYAAAGGAPNGVLFSIGEKEAAEVCGDARSCGAGDEDEDGGDDVVSLISTLIKARQTLEGLQRVLHSLNTAPHESLKAGDVELLLDALSGDPAES